MNSLDILQLTFESVENLIGEYGQKMIYDANELKLYKFVITGIHKDNNEICRVYLGRRNSRLNWMYILYSNGCKVFSDREVELLYRYKGFDIFISEPGTYIFRKKCIVFDPINNRKILNTTVDSIEINDDGILELVLSSTGEVIRIDSAGIMEV